MLAELFGRFDAAGYARLGVVASSAELEALRARCDLLMSEEHSIFYQHDADTGRYEDAPLGQGWVGPSRAYRKLEKLERDPVFAAWLADPRFAPIVRHRVGPEVALYRAMIMNKAPRIGSALPWHQDGGALWGLDAEPELQLWTALDDADETSGCLWVVPGSHALGLASPLGGVLAAPPREGAIPLPARAGEVILVHCHLWHASGPNRSEAPRRAFSACYIPASTRCTRKKKPKRSFPPVWRGRSG